MRARLQVLADRQGGLFTRQQAIDAGYQLFEIRQFIRRSGPWVVVRRGVYAERATVEAATSWSDRLLLRDLAAHLHLNRPHLMSHDSAARIHGLPMLRPVEPLVHVTRFGVGGSRTHEGVKHHLTRLGLMGTSVEDTMRVTGLARTALDLAREHGVQAGVIACDAVLQRGWDRDDLASELRLMGYWPGVTLARAAVEACDPGGESIGETLSRLLVSELDLDLPVQTQFPVPVGDHVYWCDLRIGRHLIEFDGRRKYLRREDGGVAEADVAEIVWAAKRRQDAICAHQLGMSRIVWDELFGPRRSRLKQRLLTEITATHDLFGSQLPPYLEAFARRHRDQRFTRRTQWSG